jgi:hypothetical protein
MLKAIDIIPSQTEPKEATKKAKGSNKRYLPRILSIKNDNAAIIKNTFREFLTNEDRPNPFEILTKTK